MCDQKKKTRAYFLHKKNIVVKMAKEKERRRIPDWNASLSQYGKHEDTLRILHGERLTGKGIHHSVAPVAKLLSVRMISSLLKARSFAIAGNAKAHR